MASEDQRNLSERLQLLYELGYSDLDMPYATGVHSNKMARDLDINRDLRFLDTIAVALTTGKPGDVFAAALDKRENIQLVLAKNGPPTFEDVAAANELISLIGSPTVEDALDLFPFLLRRCGAKIDKRIHSLHMSIQNTELREDFRSALQTYVPMSDIHSEFPGAGTILEMYGDAVPPFSIVWGNLVEMITKNTVHGLDAENIIISRRAYSYLFTLADSLARSRFLKTLFDDRNLTMERKERVEKLKRRLGKVCQYLSGVTHLIQKAKRLFPIPHRWVTDTFPGTGEGEFDLCSNAYDAVSRGLGHPSLSPDILDKLDKNFPFILSNWARQQTVHARIHAEIRIILHLGPLSPDDLSVRPIGVGKRSCLCCVLWIESHNRIFGTQWMTSGSHGKPYANWALPGAACPYAIEADGRSSIDKAVLEAVGVRLADTLDWLFPGQKRISDEHVSSGAESSDDEQEMSRWRLKVAEKTRKVLYGD